MKPPIPMRYLVRLLLVTLLCCSLGSPAGLMVLAFFYRYLAHHFSFYLSRTVKGPLGEGSTREGHTFT